MEDVKEKLAIVKRMYNSQLDANIALETELHASRQIISQLSAQRDFLLDRMISLEGEIWGLDSEPGSEPQRTSGSLSKPKKKKRKRPHQSKSKPTPSPGGDAADGASRKPFAEEAFQCIVELESGERCRRKRKAKGQYCGYHLPEDPTSGYVYCRNVNSSSGKRCKNPVLESTGHHLCVKHFKLFEDGKDQTDGRENN